MSSPKPTSVTHVEASAIPFAVLTAWHTLIRSSRIFKGQRLLVNGGGVVGPSLPIAVVARCHVTPTCGNHTINQLMAADGEKSVNYTYEDKTLVLKCTPRRA
ncbi:hypothetical protein V6N13_055134 [Hibiscus sabdariffa]|uniref:Uncharacterized protein n=2 Tax=Hibiscus sabdariffa TaxID=183260 RepID=A0ABR2DVM8_9ROSI